MKRIIFASVGIAGLVIAFRALPGAWAVVRPVAVLGVGLVMAGFGILAAIFPEDTDSADQRHETEPNWGG